MRLHAVGHGPDSPLLVQMAVQRCTPPVVERLKEVLAGHPGTTEVRLQLNAQGSGTRVHWTGDIIELTGLLKAVPKGLISAAAQKVIEDIWRGVEKMLSREAK